MTQAVPGSYQRKIKTVEELREVIRPQPRDRKVVMCHGTFDIVHPGHIRHLMYARDKGDILVVSLTADTHITKSNFRPFVPQELRAMNLAALEVVDFVVVDLNPTPLENISRLQPDYFIKGYEYSLEGIHPQTRIEKEVVESYGGEIIFTPGDVVYSSSAIIDKFPPNLAAEKLLVLMQAEKIGFDDLRKCLDANVGQTVHVVGDTIVDTLTQTSLIGANGKTPTFSVRFEGQVDFVGGAGIVAKHLRSAGAEVTFSTVLGDDALRGFVEQDLQAFGVAPRTIIDKTRPTTQKNAIVAGGYRLIKIDRLDNRTISDRILSQLCRAIADDPAEMVVFSDFRHGIFNRQTIPALSAAIGERVFRVADSQVASRWGNILDFKNFDLITPNEREARFALGDQDSVIRPLGSRLYSEAGCQTLILKMGERGNITFRPTDVPGELRSFIVVDTFVDHLVDAVGAGDALLAYASLALKVTGNPVIASIIGSLAAAIECEHDGNIPVSPEELRRKIDLVERRCRHQ